jgi:DNA-binding transcriptional ArsR family regulator
MMGSPDTSWLNETFGLLKNPRRRYVLYHLRHESRSTDLVTLGRHVAAWETGTTVSEVSAESVETVRVSLFHTHLPKLEDAGLVSYDPETGAVEFEGADLVGTFLDETAEFEYAEGIAAD